MFDKSKVDCPLIAVDAVIQMYETNYICLIKRKYPPLGFALPGGFVDRGESLEDAVVREVKEETDLDFTNMMQLTARSDPARDPRDHIISIPFYGFGHGEPKPKDDAVEILLVRRTEVMNLQFAFPDHCKMILEYVFVHDE